MRLLTLAQQQALVAGPSLIMLAEIDVAGDPIRVGTLAGQWTDPEGLVWSGGPALEFGQIASQPGVAPPPFTLTLSGATPSLIADARSGAVDGRRLSVWLAIVAGDPPVRVGPPVAMFRGVCERPSISNDPARPVIAVTAEGRLMRLSRRFRLRYTPAEQQRWFPGDTGFKLVAGLRDMEL